MTCPLTWTFLTQYIDINTIIHWMALVERYWSLTFANWVFPQKVRMLLNKDNIVHIKTKIDKLKECLGNHGNHNQMNTNTFYSDNVLKSSLWLKWIHPFLFPHIISKVPTTNQFGMAWQTCIWEQRRIFSERNMILIHPQQGGSAANQTQKSCSVWASNGFEGLRK